MHQIVTDYRQLFETKNIPKKEFPHDRRGATSREQLEHCHFMLDAIEKFLTEGHREKAMRWIAFIQGVLFAQSLHTIDDLKTHNRPA